MNNNIKNVLEWLEQTAERLPDKTAFDDGNEQIRFEDVRDKAQKIGAGLHRILKDVNLPIAVLSGRDVYTPIAFLGVVYAGCFYAPLDATAPTGRLKTILKNLHPAVLIISDEFRELAAELLEENPVPTVSLEELMQSEETDEDLAYFRSVRETMQPEDPLYVIHTSGSSGVPKGVLTGHASLINYINAYTKVMGITEADILGNQSPLDYIAAIRDIYIPLKTGASTYIIPKKDFTAPALLFADMTEKKSHIHRMERQCADHPGKYGCV